MVMFGSNLNASSHDTKNLPILLSMLQRLGLETDRFGTGSATMSGLEMKG